MLALYYSQRLVDLSTSVSHEADSKAYTSKVESESKTNTHLQSFAIVNRAQSKIDRIHTSANRIGKPSGTASHMGTLYNLAHRNLSLLIHSALSAQLVISIYTCSHRFIDKGYRVHDKYRVM